MRQAQLTRHGTRPKRVAVPLFVPREGSPEPTVPQLLGPFEKARSDESPSKNKAPSRSSGPRPQVRYRQDDPLRTSFGSKVRRRAARSY